MCIAYEGFGPMRSREVPSYDAPVSPPPEAPPAPPEAPSAPLVSGLDWDFDDEANPE